MPHQPLKVEPSDLPWWGWTWRKQPYTLHNPDGKLLVKSTLLVLVRPNGTDEGPLTNRNPLHVSLCNPN